jgi:DNA processing protein
MPPPQELLSDTERLDWLRLIRSAPVGATTFHRLLSRYGTAAAALDVLPALMARGGAHHQVKLCSQDDAKEEMARLSSFGARLVAFGEPDYPPLLAEIDFPPPLLAVKGDMALLAKPAVALVGARNASASGRKFAQDLAMALSAHGLAIASGLARGIDTAAHRGALAQGTVAVVAGGIDIVYPQENHDLQKMIACQGVIMAEMPFGTQPTARHFPQRNRIIAGLVLGVVVIEAARHSGSLITARYGLDYNREVMAVPGSPLDPRAAGGNELIRQGAALVTCAEDVLNALGPGLVPENEARARPESPRFSEVFQENKPESGDPGEDERQTIMEALSPTPASIDELIQASGLRPGVVQTILLELELAGRLERHGGQRVSLIL